MDSRRIESSVEKPIARHNALSCLVFSTPVPQQLQATEQKLQTLMNLTVKHSAEGKAKNVSQHKRGQLFHVL